MSRSLVLVIALCGAAACGSEAPRAVPPAPPAGPAARPATAVAFLVCGQEIWVGNDEYEEDPNAQYVGELEPLEAAIDKLGLPGRLPAGSRAVIVSYSTGARVLHPMAPVAQLTGGWFGSEKDFHGGLGDDLVAGIQVALDELAKVDARRKLVVVIGDGTTTNPDGATQAQLAALGQRAAQQHVERFALMLKSAISGGTPVIAKFAPDAEPIASADDLYPALTAIFPPQPR